MNERFLRFLLPIFITVLGIGGGGFLLLFGPYGARRWCAVMGFVALAFSPVALAILLLAFH